MFMVYGLIERLFARKKGNYQMFLEGKQQCLYKCDQRSVLHSINLKVISIFNYFYSI